MIELHDGSRLYRVTDIIEAGKRLRDREVVPGVIRIRDLIAGHDHLGLTVHGTNVTAPGENDFVSMARVAELMDMPDGHLAAFEAELAAIRREPDQVSGNATTLATRARILRQPFGHEAKLAPPLFDKTLEPMDSAWMREGREDRSQARVNVAPPIRRTPTLAEKRAALVAEIERLDAIAAGSL